MESESKWPPGLRKKLLLGLGAGSALLALIILGVGLAEMYSYEDSALAGRLHFDLDNACVKNSTLYDNRPIAFSLVSDPDRYITCGWTAGPSGFRAFACVVGVAAGVVAILCLLKFKLPSLQYIASGAAALAGLLFFIAVCWDGNSVNRASNMEVCYYGSFQTDGNTKFVCHLGRYIAVVVLDMLVAIVLVAYAVISFFFVKTGRFAIEVAENQSVDYFSEAERYFPSAGNDEGEGLAK